MSVMPAVLNVQLHGYETEYNNNNRWCVYTILRIQKKITIQRVAPNFFA